MCFVVNFAAENCTSIFNKAEKRVFTKKKQYLLFLNTVQESLEFNVDVNASIHYLVIWICLDGAT